MTEPWDRFPLPKRGDENKEKTFQGVGLVTSQWEFTESRLSRLYSVFVGEPDSLEAVHRYGSGRIFNDRIRLLELAAANFFVRHPDQQIEGAFNQLVNAAVGFSGRRNEVAHGIVYPIHELPFFSTKLCDPGDDHKHYALIPPIYLLRKHDPHGNPGYVYTSQELEALAGRLFRLSIEVKDYWTKIIESI